MSDVADFTPPEPQAVAPPGVTDPSLALPLSEEPAPVEYPEGLSAEPIVPVNPVPPGDPSDVPLADQAGWNPPIEAPPGVEQGAVPEGFMAPEQVEEVRPENELTTECCFLVYMEPDGHWMATPEVGRPVRMARVANVNDIFHAASTMVRDISSADAASKAIQLQQQMARQMLEQQQTAQLAASIGGPGGGGLDLSRFKRG